MQGALLATGREPYEESSVYSTVNFSCLARNSRETLARLEGATPYRVTLRWDAAGAMALLKGSVNV